MAAESTIETIRRIMKRQSRPGSLGTGISEIQTRYAVIDPILRSLGWDLENPAECRLERRLLRTDRRVDYALCTPNKGRGGLPVTRVLLEAKQWKHTLSHEDDEQIKDYLDGFSQYKVIGILTNGRDWKLFQIQDSKRRATGTEVIRIRNGNFDREASTLERWLSRSNWA